MGLSINIKLPMDTEWKTVLPALAHVCHWVVCSTPHALSPDALSLHTLNPCALSPRTLSTDG